MAQKYQAQQVINGTWGELWIDGQYMAEVTGFEAVVTLNKTAVNMVRQLADHQKVTGYAATGTITLNKVTSYFVNKLSDDMKAGRQTISTIISKLSDPDSGGTERIVIKDASFDELPLAGWTAKTLVEESIPFTFSDWEVIDTIADNI